ncbi:LysE family translocator [Xaviernesmea oryzae]|uniref:Threonine/homoserine/homoserine lactone efflux protein n=1 Tax=Xaviernesmea oryzae TaxID=464029 RepID=A0A1X7CTE5_9HYPH|nr:LysE family translocator [Xaviernesmea oryzae]SMF02822.1 Threonine/homoserine/homoserine lactone efflux protein [Xaviernesmea oryzae]
MIAWSIFVPACFALNCAPGPNNMLAFSNAARLGATPALLGGLGRMPAFAFLILITILGLGAVLAASSVAFTVIKFAGAVYLIYVGIQFWRKARELASMRSTDASLKALMRRDFTLAISNPKAIAIFTAFFPQFIDASQPAWSQLAAMGTVFLLLEVGAVALYVVAGVLLRKALRSERIFVYLNRLVGGVLIASGGSMALSSR